MQKICDELVAEIYDGQYTKIYDAANRQYVKRALDEGVKFNIWSDDLKKAARDAVQPAQVNKWVETVAKPHNIDGLEMQKLIEAAIAKHGPSGTLARPEEIALG